MSAIEASLLIPCHNAAQFLPRLWVTVREQTQPFAEIICYDDASTDDTAAVARQLGATVIRGSTNGGPAHARNQLWQAARGEWVHFHDADDLLTPEFVTKMTARAGPDRDVVICNAQWLSEATRQPEMEWRYSERELLAAPMPYLIRNPVGGINGLYRRAALAAINGFDEQLKIWEDADLHVRLALNGARFAVVEESLVLALRRAGSISTDLRGNWRNRLRALQHYARILPAGCAEAVGAESERAALALIRHGDTPGAREAMALARELGRDPPTSQNPLIRLCRHTLGPMTALRLQARARRS
jgi:glycosyltransferase involved in cell wall biosynthesis